MGIDHPGGPDADLLRRAGRVIPGRHRCANDLAAEPGRAAPPRERPGASRRGGPDGNDGPSAGGRRHALRGRPRHRLHALHRPGRGLRRRGQGHRARRHLLAGRRLRRRRGHGLLPLAPHHAPQRPHLPLRHERQRHLRAHPAPAAEGPRRLHAAAVFRHGRDEGEEEGGGVEESDRAGAPGVGRLLPGVRRGRLLGLLRAGA
mmetsp:Transcript_13410/g.28339  ORF Transcript_13410/g.28339 Transcript_13410/m.28339 type:complete len:203 (+) Transcript_13410:483-1091(+)